MQLRALFLIPLLAAAAASAAQLAVQNARVTIDSVEGSQLLSETLKVGEKTVSKSLELGQKDKLKLSFTITEKDNDSKGVQPHQTFLRFFDATTGEEGIQPLRVSSSGKAKFELDMARPPSSLPPSGSAPLQVTLLLGSFTYDPLSAHLFDLTVPPSAPPPKHPDEDIYHLREELHHTFRPEPRLPPRIVSAVFSVVVLAPWIALLTMLSKIPHRLPYLSSPQVLSFVALLAAFEGLLFWYWVALRLGEVLAYGAALAIPTIFAGKSALSVLAQARVESGGK